MLTLFHAPRSRSSRIIWLLEELGAPFQLRHVTIRYMDGSGDGPDPANPHPDKKVPALLDNDALVTESAAVATYLADLLPMAGLAPRIGDQDRGTYLTWISWIEGELGPAIFQRLSAGVDAPTPAAFEAALHRLDDTLTNGPYLLGEQFSAADIMLGGTLGCAQASRTSRPRHPHDHPHHANRRRLCDHPAWTFAARPLPGAMHLGLGARGSAGGGSNRLR